MRRALIARLLASSAVLVAAAAPAADDLPPPTAPGYTAVYERSSRFRETSIDEWTDTPRATITIAVLGTKSRWDHKSDGRTDLNDTSDRSTIAFGGNLPAKTAHRSVTPGGIDWEFGYGKTAADAPPPERLGTETIAGQECTRLKFTSEMYGTPEFCVAKTGIVLRFRNATPIAETTLEAVSVTAEPPAADRFAVPDGYVVEAARKLRAMPPIAPPAGAR